jgi:hypothetical protein
MSQFFVSTTGGNLPPSVATSYVTDINSPSIPIANVEKVLGGSVTTNNVKGIQTDGSSGSNTITAELTNRITGSATTTDGSTPVIVYTFPLGATPGVYQFTINVVGFDLTDNIGAAFTSFRGVRTTGAAGVLINANTAAEGEEGAMTVAEVVNGISGNNLILTVTGLAGKTIHWQALTTYVFVS